MEILHFDPDIIVCVKPPRVLSTDEPGGLPDMLREYLGDPKADIRTVHRLDRVVSGLMVVARNAFAASELSRQIREDQFGKTYLAVVRGKMDGVEGVMTDLLLRNKAERKTYIVDHLEKGVQEAILKYEVISETESFSKVKIRLITGRTHQIRAQFSGHGHSLVGDRKYATFEDPCEIALWSHEISFLHPSTGIPMTFSMDPPCEYPWNLF